MKVVALVHFAVPFRMAGSETMLHTLLEALAERGHDVLVVTTHTPQAPQQWRWGRVRGLSRRGPVAAAAAVRRERPDVIVTHHDNAALGIDLARSLRSKSVFLMHNDFDLNQALLARRPDLTVFNTQWIADRYGDRVPSWVVVHPPVRACDHATEPGDRVTLVNLNEHKGASVLYELARRMPDVRFLGVTGGHGDQIRIRRLNIEIIQQTTDMPGDVWARTRVLLMPSVYESYGMAGVEALASGIPVLATPTPGLRESLDHAGIFIDRTDLDCWERELRRLLAEPRAWAAASERALKRSAELDAGPELEAWVRAVEEVAGHGSSGDDG